MLWEEQKINYSQMYDVITCVRGLQWMDYSTLTSHSLSHTHSTHPHTNNYISCKKII